MWQSRRDIRIYFYILLSLTVVHLVLIMFSILSVLKLASTQLGSKARNNKNQSVCEKNVL